MLFRSVIVHQEACPHLHRVLGQIRSLGIKAGVALNPATPVSSVFDVLDLCDLVLIMTVNPGWGGQPFIKGSLRKIERLRAELDNSKIPALIEVDGGINAETGKQCLSSGADVLVAGSYILGHKDRRSAMAGLRMRV